MCSVVRLTTKYRRIRQEVKDGAKRDLQWKPESNEENWKDIQSRLFQQIKENQVKTVSKNKVL